MRSKNLHRLLALTAAAMPVLAHAGVFVIREGNIHPLLGTYSGTEDNAIDGALPSWVPPADVDVINTGNAYSPSRGALYKFNFTDPAMALVADGIVGANFTLFTSPTSIAADESVLVRFATLTSSNANWSESDTSWQNRRVSTSTPWAGGAVGPIIAGADYRTPSVDRTIPPAQMNSGGVPVRAELSPTTVRDWIKSPSSNGGVFAWSSSVNTPGTSNDNFQVHSSESPSPSLRPTLTIRYKSPFTRAVFDQQDLSINNGDGYKNSQNTDGALSWGESYIMRGYMQMYRATRDTYYLDKLVNHADAVLANRDDVNPNPETAPGWTQGAVGYMGASVSSGHIVWPMAEFARVVKSDPALAAYHAKADAYIAKAEETMNWLDNTMRFDLLNDHSAYRVYPNGPIQLGATNGDMTAAMVLEQLYGATGNPTHRDLADRVARTTRTLGLYTTDQGNLAWSYSYSGASDAEDTSHGALVAPLIARLARQGRVFSPVQMQGLVQSLMNEAFLGAGQFDRALDAGTISHTMGTDPFEWAHGVAGGLADLAQFNLKLLPLAEAVQLRNYGTSAHNFGWPLHAIASMVRYNQIPQEMTVTATVTKNGITYRCEIPASLTLVGPTELVLVNDANPGDVQRITLDLGGSGDDWAQTWQLALNVNAGTSAALQGGTLRLTVSGLGGYQDPKTLLGTVLPGGYALVDNGPSGQLTAVGVLGANSTFLFNANEVAKNESFWALDANGQLSDAVNFAGGAPNGVNATANFLAVNSAPRTLTNSGSIALGTLRFASTNAYTLDGTGTINLAVSSGAASIAVTAGDHTISSSLRISSSVDVDAATGASLSLPGNISTAPGVTLKKLGEGLLAMRHAKVSHLQIDAGQIQINALPSPTDPTGTCRVSSLSITGTGALDLTNNAVVVDYSGASPVESIRAMLVSGRNDGLWNGNGVRSSSAAANTITAVGLAEASDLFTSFPAIFAGESIDATSLLMRYTLVADANLDGQVNSADFNLLTAHYGESNARWSLGDFDYNGKVDTLDFNLLAGSFGASLPSGMVLSGATVPEPRILGMVVLSIPLLMMKRRRFSSDVRGLELQPA